MGTTPFSFRRLRLLFLPVGRVVVCRHRPVTHSGNEWAHKRAKSKKENKNATTQMKEKKQELTDECQRLSAEELCVCVGGRAHFRSLQEENRYTSARRTPYKCSRERVTVKAVLQLSIWLSWCRCCSVCYKEGGRALMTPCVYFIPLQLNVGFLPLLFFLGFTGSTVTLQLCNDAS